MLEMYFQGDGKHVAVPASPLTNRKALFFCLVAMWAVDNLANVGREHKARKPELGEQTRTELHHEQAWMFLTE